MQAGLLFQMLAVAILTTVNAAAARQPTKFEFGVNLKTTKQISLTIPQWTLMKASKVIR